VEIAIFFKICTIIFLLIFSGFFSGSEAALFSLSLIQRERLKKNKRKQANTIEKLLSQPQKLITTILIGNDLVNIAASVVAAYLCISIFSDNGRWLAMALMTPLTLIFAEVIPKTISANNNEKIAPVVSGFLNLFGTLIAPLAWLFENLANLFIKMTGIKRHNGQEIIMENDFLDMVKIGHEDGELKGIERDLIHNVFEFSDAHVFEVMVPLEKACLLSYDMKGEEIISFVKKNRRSRIPVYNKHVENITGILYAKDLLKIDIKKNKDKTGLLPKICRKPYFVQETEKIDTLFNIFKLRRIHMAICMNEHSQVTGLITMEDILEELFGQIYDHLDMERS
jgi:putative hemolysin